MKTRQPQELTLANGITLSITHTMKDQNLVYNAVGYRTGDPTDIVATFGYDLTASELVTAIFNIADDDSFVHLLIPEYLEPFSDEFSFSSVHDIAPNAELEEQPYASHELYNMNRSWKSDEL
jgi:hypothetical protein